jgi:hypothetical protein
MRDKAVKIYDHSSFLEILASARKWNVELVPRDGLAEAEVALDQLQHYGNETRHGNKSIQA